MPSRRSLFPVPLRATAEGIVAVGGRPDAATLREAYRRGIFPWPHEGLPLLWFCPDPRFVLEPAHIHLSRSLVKELRRGRFEIRVDTAFDGVIHACARRRREGQRDGTWITPAIIAGYSALHDQGLAHSVEAWQEGRLVGGLYGVSLGAAFFGESMFADVSNASKVCLATLVANLAQWGFRLLDCQQTTEHLASFGAVEWPRVRFLRELRTALAKPTRIGPWAFDIAPGDAAACLEPQAASDGAEGPATGPT